MSTCTAPRTDRLVNGRFVRNLALSLSGGALLTLVGAGVAAADEAGTASTGTAGTGTGDATAVGNASGTSTKQGVAPSAGSSNPTVVTQTATVPNVGIAVANTGGNTAVGNDSTNSNSNTQTATGGSVATSNSGSVANVSDGTASITTGAATAYGNQSTTAIDQSASGALGIITTQSATIANTGVGVANTGLNNAAGNTSTNSSGFVQNASNPTGLASNAASSTNASNGSATIVTGAAAATGNKSDTSIAQSGGGTGDGDPGGLLVIGQGATVTNLGIGIANSGGNNAVGNTSTNFMPGSAQTATVGDSVVADQTVASNSLDVTNGSDGTAEIRTGAASATGNDANTNLTQASWGDPDEFGAIVATQDATVGNIGVGVANTGLNNAVGNTSLTTTTGNQMAQAGGAGDVITAPTITATNGMAVDNLADGTAIIRTGDATAVGNDSDTTITQDSNSTFTPGSMGIVPVDQGAAVTNLGIGVANSGGNNAVGNASGTLGGPNVMSGAQNALIDPAAALDVTGPVTANNSLSVSQHSDGTGLVISGAATATGNSSETTIEQSLDSTVDGMGLIVAPQDATVANLGAGVANSGLNNALGNASSSVTTATSTATFNPGVATTVDGPVTVGNSHSLSNESDGEACSCSGNATASGNVARSTLRQDLDITAEDGFHVAPTTGVIFNAGFGLANSGVNNTTGNISDNDLTLTQTAIFAPGAVTAFDEPQTIVNSGSAGNASDGGAKVGSGNASATGNLSDSTLEQAAVIDGAGTIAALGSTISNVGAGVANSGVNTGVGNASTNAAVLAQVAAGTGAVANSADVSNSSDGTATIGDCEDEAAPPTADEDEPGEPGAPTLPRTGGAIETMAAVALMLLLAGFATQGLAAQRRRVAA